MRHRTKLLTTAAVMLLPLAQPSLAQTTQTAQPTPASPVDEDVQSDDIVVTGIRASIQRAQDIKRQSPSVVEAITLEDLGKFTDASISDALSRVPGVTIERNARGREGGDGVTIRGLGPQYLRSTVNGRDLFGISTFGGNGGRQFDFESIPPEILAGVTVYKSPTANLPELGLAGGVDLRTLRPLDYKAEGSGSVFGSASITGLYETNSQKVSPRIGGIVGFKLADDTIGLYVSGVHSEQRTKQREFFHYNQFNDLRFAAAPGGPVTTRKNVQLPLGFYFGESERKYTRDSAAAGAQWRPSDKFEVNLDFLYNKFKLRNFNPSSDFILGSLITGTEVFQPGGGTIRGNELILVDSRRVTGGGLPYQRAGFQDIENINQFYNAGANVAWRPSEDVRVVLDYAHGYSRYTTDWLYPLLTNAATGIDVVYDGSGKIPTVQFFPRPGTNPSSPGVYTDGFNFAFDTEERTRRDTFRFDIEGKASDAVQVRVGAYYQESVRSYVRAFNFNSGPVNGTGIFSGTIQPPLYNIALPRVDRQLYCAANSALCALSHFGKGSFTGQFPTSSTGFPGEDGFDAGSAYLVKETNLAFYGQVDAKGIIGGLEYSGNAGLRAVRITENARAFQGVETRVGEGKGPIAPGTTSTTALVRDNADYWEFLPSANLTLRPATNINLRFSAARTISLAGYDALAPKGTATITVPDANGNRQPSLFNGGNTQLKPTSALNYDITAEYYTPNGGAFVASLFYKDVKNLVTNSTVNGSAVPGQTGVFNSSTFVNADRGYSYGFEVGATVPFSMITPALEGFGAQANYTYVESKLRSGAEEYQFPGAAKHNVNLSAFYERGGFAARVAYNYRTKNLAMFVADDHSIFNRAQGTVDFSVSQKFAKNFEVVITGTNVNNSNVSQYYGSGEAFHGFYERATIYSGAIRVIF